MNTLEQKALNWLTFVTGFNASDILYSNNTSPDFVLPDGRGFEVKRLHGRHGIELYPRQWEQLLKYENCQIAVWDPRFAVPIFLVPVPNPYGIKRWQGLNVVCNAGVQCREADRDARVNRMHEEHPLMSHEAIGRIFHLSRQMVRKIRLREAQREKAASG